MVELWRGRPRAGLPDQKEPIFTPVRSSDQPDLTEKVFVASRVRPRTAGKTSLCLRSCGHESLPRRLEGKFMCDEGGKLLFADVDHPKSS